MTSSAWHAEPLIWGHGPKRLEIFVEPTCPFSVKALGKLDELLAAAGSNNLTICVRLQSQPWHMYSGVIVRSILAASTLPEGKEQAKAVMTAVGAHREEFEFEHHASGPNMNTTPAEIVARIEFYSSVELAQAFSTPDLDRAIKWQCKYARQNGIHVSPTFMVDGLVQSDMGSGDTIEEWLKKLGLPPHAQA